MPVYFPPLTAPYTTEEAQDAVGAMVDASLVYVDATPLLSRAALTGDVTASQGSNATTIAANAVTYAKMQDVSATSRVIGRKTSGAGDPEELTMSEVLDFVGSAAQGDILYRNASAWVRLGAGTSGQLLKTNGAGANPSWATASAGSGTLVPESNDFRVWERFAHPASNTIGSAGSSISYTGTGTTASNNDSDGEYLKHTTPAATTGSGTSQLPNTYNTTQRQRSPAFISNTKSDAAITSMRFWSGFFSGSPTASDDPAVHLAAFRYSTGAGDTDLMACVKDGSTLNAASTGVTVATTTKYDLRIELDSAEVRFYVNGTLTNTLTANLPAATQAIAEAFSVTTLANAFASWNWANYRMRHRQ